MKTLESNTNPHAAGKAAHTEGSWHIGLAATERAIYGQYGEHIATLPDMLASDEVTANARLIAAAPELLEQVEAFERFAAIAAEGRVFNPDQIKEAMAFVLPSIRAAIARATGQGGEL